MVTPAGPSIVWPTADTAFVVTHGNLPKDPFWVIDRFARGLVAAFGAARPTMKIELEHKLRRRPDEEGGPSERVESYVRLSCAGSDACIDIYEYYWDVYMVHPPSWSSLRAWLGMLASNAKQLHLRRELDLRQKEPTRAKDDPEYRWGTVFIGLWGLAWVLSWLPSWIPWADRLMFLPTEMARFASDTTTYLAVTVRSGDYRIRREILDGAVRQVTSVLGDERYGTVVLAGHSLGSIIMYDVINRLRRDACAPPGTEPGSAAQAGPAAAAALERLGAFVSFGSPLDKVAYFFQRYVPDDEDVRRQITEHLHGFRRKKLDEPLTLLDVYGGRAAEPLRTLRGAARRRRGSKALSASPRPEGGQAALPVSDPMCSVPLAGLTWLNFYHVLDGAAGCLDTYGPVENIPCRTPVRTRWRLFGLWRAHGSYWDSQPKKRGQRKIPSMYDIIVKKLFAAPRPEGVPGDGPPKPGAGETAEALPDEAGHIEFAV